ncbi:MAG: cupin domain-containing protein [Candidatus Omnitrophica bacterium]|nr:cupin domain-containing protein [Candidatus Omnitrophota bacterium]
MKSLALLDDLVFHDENPNAQPLLVDAHARILRFTLKPGQKIKEHLSPNSPLYIVVIEGRGIFAGSDGKRVEFGPNSFLVFDKAEPHLIEARDENLVFIAFLREFSENIPEEKTGGLLGER